MVPRVIFGIELHFWAVSLDKSYWFLIPLGFIMPFRPVVSSFVKINVLRLLGSEMRFLVLTNFSPW